MNRAVLILFSIFILSIQPVSAFLCSGPNSSDDFMCSPLFPIFILFIISLCVAAVVLLIYFLVAKVANRSPSSKNYYVIFLVTFVILFLSVPTYLKLSSYMEERDQISRGLSLVNYDVYLPEETKGYKTQFISITGTHVFYWDNGNYKNQDAVIGFDVLYRKSNAEWFNIMIKEKPGRYLVEGNNCSFHDKLQIPRLSSSGITIQGECHVVKTPRYDWYQAPPEFNSNFSFVTIDNTIIYIMYSSEVDFEELKAVVDSLRLVDKYSLKVTTRLT